MRITLNPLTGRDSRDVARGGFTLVELLVVVVIISILASMTLGAVAKAREAGRVSKTQATIAKLNDILQRMYDKYRTRRLPVSFETMQPSAVAKARCDLMRDLMRMELPQTFTDITTAPTASYSLGTLPVPAMQARYKLLLGSTASTVDHQPAKCLYMIVMNAGADARSQFTADEIAMNIDGDNMPCFVDGWGNPIGFLRWAPGFSPWSDIQYPDPLNHHDPFDPRNVYSNAYHLYPFIFAGVVGKTSSGTDDYGLNLATGVGTIYDPFSNPTLGQVLTGFPYTNQHMEMK